MIDPDFEITDIERAHLATLTTTDGFKVLQKILEAEVSRFNLALLNTRATNQAEVLSAHNLAQAAAQFYQGVVDRLNKEKLLYEHMPRKNDKPVDATEGLIDLGEVVEQLKDVPNLLGEDF